MLQLSDFDSKDEYQFYIWLLEAKAYGEIQDFEYQPKSIEIFPPVKIPKYVQLKTKVRVDEQHVLNGMKYTPDFAVTGDLYSFDLLDYRMKSENIIEYFNKKDIRGENFPLDKFYIDIKGSFTMHNDSAKFSVIQKALWHRRCIYVNKVTVAKFFKKAWLPKPVLEKGDPIWTNKTKKSEQRPRKNFEGLKTYEWVISDPKTGAKELVPKECE